MNLINLKPRSDLYIGEIPRDTEQLFVNNVGCIRYTFNEGRESAVIEPEQLGFYATNQNCIIIGTFTEMEMDFDLADVIETIGCIRSKEVYEDYSNPANDMFFHTQLESWKSLLAANDLYYENPMKEPSEFDYHERGKDFKYAFTEWQKLEDKLIGDRRFILLKQV